MGVSVERASDCKLGVTTDGAVIDVKSVMLYWHTGCITELDNVTLQHLLQFVFHHLQL
jgi:hypothetical protein